MRTVRWKNCGVPQGQALKELMLGGGRMTHAAHLLWEQVALPFAPDGRN
jgi:hypothetical protein